MIAHLFAALVAAQQQPVVPPSPVARVVVTPAKREVAAGDSLRFSAQALDASGAPMPNVRIVFQEVGGEGGTIDSTGLLIAGSTGLLNATAVATVSGTRPVVERFEVKLVPGPASRVVVSPHIQKLAVGQRIHLMGTSYSKKGDERADEIAWTTSAPSVARVDTYGVVRAVAPGRATITARVGTASSALPVQVIPNTIATIDVTPNRSNARTGDVIRFKATPRDASGKEIAGLTPTWTFQPGKGQIEQDGAFVGYEPGAYFVTASFGPSSADAAVRLGRREVRRKVTVVGRVARTAFTTAEVWLHPNGRVAYLGTHGGGDRFYAIDITNPAKPVIVDSVVMNTRLVNDIMTSGDGKILVATREGAADRKNGIVICTLDDPLHPKVVSEFTQGVTSGVHSAFVHTQAKYGTHVYLTNDGTGAVHIIDINDPAHPTEVAQWRTDRPDAGRYLHDIDVQNGLLYGSWWNDGLVILDVGNGMKGGTPSKPVLVSQFKYDLDKMYKQVEEESGHGFTRGTHTAWRHNDYVFIADEVYRAEDVRGAKDASANRMYGRLQVIDVSDIEHPKSVAYYEPEQGGVHNVWVLGDTLYMGAYDAGFRAFDISGELRGDLRAQGREMAALITADMDGAVKNAPQTWGVVVNPKDGLAYVNDFNNGLWIVRLEPREKVVP
jgi:hypothetical protein